MIDSYKAFKCCIKEVKKSLKRIGKVLNYGSNNKRRKEEAVR